MSNNEKIKIEELPFIKDRALPKLVKYEEILYTPEDLGDINKAEGTKLENALDKTVDTSDDLPQGTTNKYLLDLSVTKFKLAVAAVEWEKIANEAVKANNIWTGGNVITLSAQIKEAIIQDAHIASLSAIKITTGTLIGRTVKTSDAGDEVVLEAGGALADYLLFYHSNVLEGFLYALTGILTIVGGAGTSGALILGVKNYPLLMKLMNTGITVYRNITMGAGITVDGVDISAFKTSYNALAVDFIDHSVGNPSAHHSKYTDANARSAVTDYNLPGDLDLNNHDVIDVRYLIFDSSYGQISRGTDLMFDFFGDHIEAARHFTPSSPNTYNCGSSGDYWKEVHYKSLVPHSPNVLKDSEGLEILYSIKKKKDGKIDPINIDERVKTEKGKNGRLELTQLVMANIAATKELNERVKRLEG